MRSDFDNNNKINMLDFAAFAETWLASPDSANFAGLISG